MSGTATTPAATKGDRRLDLRLTELDYKRLKRAASDQFRSVPAEARYLIVRGLKGGEQDNGAKGGR